MSDTTQSRRIAGAYAEVVSCVIPGHHQPGTELYADAL